MRNGGRRRSLAGTLGVQAAFGVLVPGLTVVLVAYLYLSYRLDMVQADHEGRIEALVGRDVERHAQALAERLDAFVAERIRDARAWGPGRTWWCGRRTRPPPGTPRWDSWGWRWM